MIDTEIRDRHLEAELPHRAAQPPAHLLDPTFKAGTLEPGLRPALLGLRETTRTVVQIRKAKKRRDHIRHAYDPHAFDTCPVPPSIYLILGDCRDEGISFGVISADRRAGVAERFGHSSQAALYNHWRNGDPGYLPANPPGSSTHEYFNGGNGGTPAFPRLAVGLHLPPNLLGLDLRSNAEATAFCRAADEIGWHFFQPYPTTSEAHHVCLRMPMEKTVRHLVKRGVIR